LTVDSTLNLGPNMRFVIFTDRVELQYKDSLDVWQIQTTYSES
jgi:hypothetical protein